MIIILFINLKKEQKAKSYYLNKNIFDYFNLTIS